MASEWNMEYLFFWPFCTHTHTHRHFSIEFASFFFSPFSIQKFFIRFLPPKQKKNSNVRMVQFEWLMGIGESQKEKKWPPTTHTHV